MRFFRIPGFTGIEAHRDDADRGSLRVVEGCLPHGTGGLRSGPVWKEIGRVDHFGHDERNNVSAADDGNGNSVIFVSRNCLVHDMVIFSEENTKFDSLGTTYDVATSVAELFSRDEAVISSIGNRLYAIGDGSQEALYIGKGPVGSGAEVYPDEQLYSQEWSRFPNCQYYARGPKATIFAAGNPDKPLTVYISEPAGLTSSFKDSPYSTEAVSDLYNSGRLSTVDILGSDASKITALSTRGDQVVVHTDKGAFLLYAPSPDQASTGYRVEQAPATNFSSAVNHQVVSGENGTQTFWLGHDGQVYKDEAASRGSAELKSNADQDQANWKSKGVWEHELPTDLSNSFSVFSAQSGDYMFFVESEESLDYPFHQDYLGRVVNFNATESFSVYYSCEESGCPARCDEQGFLYDEDGNVVREGIFGTPACAGEKVKTSCCQKYDGLPDPDRGRYATCEECAAASSCTHCCCEQVDPFNDVLKNTYEELLDLGYSEIEAEVLKNTVCCGIPFTTKFKISDCSGCIQDPLGDFDTFQDCMTSFMNTAPCFYDYTDCGECEITPGAKHLRKDLCEAAKLLDPECDKYEVSNCTCTKEPTGSYSTLADCETALSTDIEYIDCWGYTANGCDCEPAYDGIHLTLDDCENYVKTQSQCMGYDLDTCDCNYVVDGEYANLADCQAEALKNSLCQGYNRDGCECVPDTTGSPEFSLLRQCESDVNQDPACNTWDIEDCVCKRNPLGLGTYPNYQLCQDDASSRAECKEYTITGCACVESIFGFVTGLEACEEILSLHNECKKYNLTSDCKCVEAEEGTYDSFELCEFQRKKCTKYTIDYCSCVEDEEGEILGLDTCETILSEPPYTDACVRYDLISCGCYPRQGGAYGTIDECRQAVEEDIACRGKWRFPKTGNFFEGNWENQCHCKPEDAENPGVFDSYESCQIALSQVNTISEHPGCWKPCIVDGNGCLTCVHEDDPGYFSLPNGVNRPTEEPTQPEETYYQYCSVEGEVWTYVNYSTYDPCALNASALADPDSKYAGLVFNTSDIQNFHQNCGAEGELPCNDCPPPKWVIEAGSNDCYCSNRVPGSDEIGYDSKLECETQAANICGSYSINLASCTCETRFDNLGEFENLSLCEQALDISSECAYYTLDDNCQCVQTTGESGATRGVAHCTAQQMEVPECAPHWIVDCNCVTTDPGDGSESFTGFDNCTSAIPEKHPECFCDDTSTDYFVDPEDGNCANIGGGNGTHTECQCIEEGRTILT